MYKPNGAKGERFILKRNDSPSPVTYDSDKSFKETQLKKGRFFISKSKIVSLSDQVSKNKSFVPGVGNYDYDQALSKISKGLAQRKR